MIHRKIVLHFPPHLVDQAIIYRLVKDYDLIFAIHKARISPKREGILVMEISGTRKEYNLGIKYLVESGVGIQPLSRDISWNEDRCTHCGACLAVCPTDALTMDRQTMLLQFDNSKCVACEACVTACPARAMEVQF